MSIHKTIKESFKINIKDSALLIKFEDNTIIVIKNIYICIYKI